MTTPEKKVPDRILNVVVAIFIFFATIVCAVWMGDILSGLVRISQDRKATFLGLPIAIGTGALAITVLISTARDALAMLANLRVYFKELSSVPILQDAIKMFCSVVALIVAVPTFVPPIEIPEPPKQAAVIAAVSLDDPEPIVVFPILYEENGAATNLAEALRVAHDGRTMPENIQWTAGVEPTPTMLTEIVALLGECALGDKPYSIQLQVVGYASSREFGRSETPEQIEDSNNLNVVLANARASHAAKAIEDKIPATLRGKFWIETHEPWQGYEEMVSARPVLDRYFNARREELENWTRRVDVRVLMAGNCTRRSFLERTDVIRRARAAPTQMTATDLRESKRSALRK